MPGEKISSILEYIYHLFILNTLFIAFSLPVLTIGISQCALYESIKDLKSGEASNPLKVFIKKFKDNFKNGLSLGIFELVAILLIIVDFMIINAYANEIVQAILYAGSFFLFTLLFYSVPVSVKYKGTLYFTLKQSLFLLFLHIKRSLVIVLLSFLLFELFKISLGITMAMISIYIVIGCSLVAYFQLIMVDSTVQKVYEGRGNKYE